MAKKTIKDLTDLKGQRLLIRVDFNVPLEADGAIANDRRIRAALPTIQYGLERGASAVVMSHLGRPKGDPAKDAPFKMDRVAARLKELLGTPVHKVDQVVGDKATAAAAALKPGEVLVLENLRFHPGEQAGDPAFAQQLGSLGSVYVNDAFGTCHRKDASMVAVPAEMKGKPRVVGLLVSKELDVLNQLLNNPKKPMIGVLGGAKVSDKIGFIKAMLQRVDRLLIGGAMAYTFMAALGKPTGKSRVEKDKVDVARQLLDLAKTKITLPVDFVVVDKPDATAKTQIVEAGIPDGLEGLDIGPKTRSQYADEIAKAATVVWNGPVGKFEDEPFSHGTKAIAKAMADSKAVTVVGGGETAEAVEEFGLDSKMTHVSTGGGAFLEYIAGTPFPALAEIDDK
ncbi:MAG TPA: phosphoglycerate kinase [Gemmataceae bacterium]|nr:phosphoglycerate kinase [Gemmataceae bacterium]